MGASTPGDAEPSHVGVILEALRAVESFEFLDRDSLTALAASARARSATAGETVVRRGESADAFYVVASGLLEVLSTSERERVRSLRAGSVFGELALLTDLPRTATVRAIRDSDLWELPRTVFEALLNAEPRFSASMLRAVTRLALESFADAATEQRPATVVAVAPARPDVEIDAFCDALRVAARGQTKMCDQSSAGDPASWGRCVDAMEREADLIVLRASAQRDAWFHFCLREADRAAIVAPAGEIIQPLPEPTRPVDIVVVSERRRGRSARTSETLAVRARHVVDAHSAEAAYAMAARRVLGRSVGVVLSGGGARGLAHIGALDALRRAGIRIDRFGGTSMGALIGALAASGRVPVEIESLLRRELKDNKPFSDWAVSRSSLLRGRRARAMLDRLFGNELIEELTHDFFCISADLLAAETVEHRQGLVAFAVGASMSLPGLATPLRDHGRLLVDGGVLNNLPVETMAAMEEGPIIAIDVLSRGVRGGKHSAGVPSMIETVARSSTLASRKRADHQRSLATVAIAPELRDIALLHFGRFDEIVALGRHAAEEQLAAGATNIQESLEAPSTRVPTVDWQ